MSFSVEESLRSLAFSASLPDSVVIQLCALASMERAGPGTILFREGSVHDGISLVVDGHVSLEMNVPGRGDLRILSLSTGDVLAWSALLAHGRMTASAVAVSDVQLLTFRGSELRQLCESNHEVGFHVMQRVATALSRRLLATRLQLLDLFTAQPPPIDPRPKV
jgi:CRP/FNR family transcriptional regulator, cyclic AMP receptor protein